MKTKKLPINKTQAKALANGATMLLMELGTREEFWTKRLDWCNKNHLSPFYNEHWDMSLIGCLPLQVGDEFEAIFPHDEYQICNECGTKLDSDFNECPECESNSLKYIIDEESRFTDLIVKAIEVKRVDEVFKKLDTKNKKAYESFTYHRNDEPINQKRRRGFDIFLKEQNISTDGFVALYTVGVQDGSI